MKNNNGYSLIELIIVIVLVGVLAPFIVKPVIHNFKAYIVVADRKDINEYTRSAMDRLVREVRNVRRKVNNTLSITVADAATIEFENNKAEKVAFSWGGTPTVDPLLRGGDILVPAEEITSFEILYFDIDNKLLADLPLSLSDRESVDKIEFSLVLSKNGDTMAVNQQVYLRNITGY